MEILQQQEQQQQRVQTPHGQQSHFQQPVQNQFLPHYQPPTASPASQSHSPASNPLMSPPHIMSPPMTPQPQFQNRFQQNSNQQIQQQRNGHFHQNAQMQQQQQHLQRQANHQPQRHMQQQQFQPNQKFVNVQRSPKIDESKIAEIKKELKSPPNRMQQQAATKPVQMQQNHQTMQHRPQQHHPLQQHSHQQQQQQQQQPQVVNRPSIIRRTDSAISQKPPPPHQPAQQMPKKVPQKKPKLNTAGPAFGNSQLRVAPGAGPLPGLSQIKQEPGTSGSVPKIGTLREEQRMRQIQFEQQKQQNFIQQQSSMANTRIVNRQQQRQFVGPRTTPVVPQQRPGQVFNAVQEHRVMPVSNSSTSPGRKPWDLNLQAPRRQSGIEVVSRKPPQQNGQAQLQHQQNMRHQQQQFGIQPQMQRAPTVLAPDAPLRPGFQIYNGQLIEVRPTNTFNISHMQHQQQQQRFQQQQQRHIVHQQQNRSNDVKMFQHQKRPGWDSASFSVAPPPPSTPSQSSSSNQLSQLEKEALINEKKNQATEKLIKKSKMKATKLIWDPIVLDEGIMLEEINEQNGMIKTIEVGYDDSFDFSPLWASSKQKSICDDVIEIRSTPTPPSVDAEEEYELFFSIVSDDGFSQSGKNLDDIWNGILDQLELGNTFPGAAPRSTRPDVYKVTKIYFYRFYANF